MIEYLDDDNSLWITCDALTVGDYGGSGSVGEANVRYALAHIDGAHIERGYSSRTAWLPGTQANRDLISGLERDYPLIDEEMHSQIESEWEDKAWHDFGRAGLCRAAARTNPALSVAFDADLFSEDDLHSMYRSSMDTTNSHPKMEYSGAYLPIDHIAPAFADIAVDAVFSMISTRIDRRVEFDFDDDTDRLICADWLEDHDEPALAEFLRAYCEAARDE